MDHNIYYQLQKVIKSLLLFIHVNVKYLCFVNELFVCNILNQPDLIFLDSVK